MKKRHRAPLGELCELVKGTSPITKTSAGQYPLVTTGQDHKTAANYQFDTEAVCIPLISSTGHGHASLKRVHYQSGKFALANLLVAALIKDKTLLSPKYLAQYLTFTKDRLIVPLMTGAANMSISIDRLATIPVEFPALDEQTRIAKLLDEAGELRSLRDQTDDRTNAVVPALFHRMFGMHIAAPPIVTATVGLRAPRGWRWAQLNEVGRLASGHTPSRRHPEWWGGDVPWISLTDIRELDGTIATTTSEYVNEEGIANSSSVKLPKGTVCFSRTASVGFVTIMGREMATSQDFVNWVCGRELDPTFLMAALMQAREHLRSLASGSTHKTIYFPTVKQFATILPPLALQKEFAARATEIRALRAKQLASRRRVDDLFKSLLHRSFNGGL